MSARAAAKSREATSQYDVEGRRELDKNVAKADGEFGSGCVCASKGGVMLPDDERSEVKSSATSNGGG